MTEQHIQAECAAENHLWSDPDGEYVDGRIVEPGSETFYLLLSEGVQFCKKKLFKSIYLYELDG